MKKTTFDVDQFVRGYKDVHGQKPVKMPKNNLELVSMMHRLEADRLVKKAAHEARRIRQRNHNRQSQILQSNWFSRLLVESKSPPDS